MVTPDRAHPLHLTDIDTYLGPGEQRFFAEGYRRADQQLHSIILGGRDTEAPQVAGTGRVDYPADWSRKGAIDQRQHLSTIDVLVLAVRLAELHLLRYGGLTPPQLRGAWVRAVRIKAGSAPVEQDLAGFAVSAYRRQVRPSDRRGCVVSVLDCRIATFTVQLEVDHAEPDNDHTTADDIVAQWHGGSGPFGAGLAGHRQIIDGVTVTADRLSAAAVVRFTATGASAAPCDGMEGDYQPAVSMIDRFVVVLQLGQVMLYELDGISRAESSTLWMRSTVFQASSPTPIGEHPVPIFVSLVDPQVLHTRDGVGWRRADITARGADSTVVCSVAHQLP